MARRLARLGYDLVATSGTYKLLTRSGVPCERVYKLAEDHDAKDLSAALQKGHEWGDQIPLGIFYQVERPTLADALPGLKKGPLNKRDISDIDISSLLVPMGGK